MGAQTRRRALLAEVSKSSQGRTDSSLRPSPLKIGAVARNDTPRHWRGVSASSPQSELNVDDVAVRELQRRNALDLEALVGIGELHRGDRAAGGNRNTTAGPVSLGVKE